MEITYKGDRLELKGKALNHMDRFVLSFVRLLEGYVTTSW